MYFSNLSKRYCDVNAGSVVCCNMLRCDPSRGETVLSDCFQECVRYVRKTNNLDVRLINFDWHFNLKQLGPEDSLTGLFTVLGEPIKSIDLTCGEAFLDVPNDVDLIVEANENDWSANDAPRDPIVDDSSRTMFADALVEDELFDSHTAGNDDDDLFDNVQVSDVSPMTNDIPSSRSLEFAEISMDNTVIRQGVFNTVHGSATIVVHSLQKGVLRFNCADSLDRTNIASFFTSFQIMAEQLRRLGLAIGNKHETTTWPLLTSPSLQSITGFLGTGVCCSLAELFIQNGDVCSLLYTNSVASHSYWIRQYSPRLHAAPSDVKISLLRRFQNVVKDSVCCLLYVFIRRLDKSNLKCSWA